MVLIVRAAAGRGVGGARAFTNGRLAARHAHGGSAGRWKGEAVGGRGPADGECQDQADEPRRNQSHGSIVFGRSPSVKRIRCGHPISSSTRVRSSSTTMRRRFRKRAEIGPLHLLHLKTRTRNAGRNVARVGTRPAPTRLRKSHHAGIGFERVQSFDLSRVIVTHRLQHSLTSSATRRPDRAAPSPHL